MEYIVLSTTTRQAKEYNYAFKQFNINIPIQLYYNNQSSINLVQNPIYYYKTKYIHIAYHYTKSCLINNIIQLANVLTKGNTTDIMMKGLTNDLHSRFNQLLRYFVQERVSQ